MTRRADSSSLTQFAERHGLSEPLRRIDLGQRVRMADAESDARAEVWLTNEASWLIAAASPDRGTAVDLGSGHYSYRRGRRRARLFVAGLELEVPGRARKHVEEIIGMGRLMTRFGAGNVTRRKLTAGELALFGAEVSAVQSYLIRDWLGDEPCLGLELTKEERWVGSKRLTPVATQGWYVLTPERAALQFISPMADVEIEALPPEALSLDGKQVKCGGIRWQAQNAAQFKVFEQCQVYFGAQRCASVLAGRLELLAEHGPTRGATLNPLKTRGPNHRASLELGRIRHTLLVYDRLLEARLLEEQSLNERGRSTATPARASASATPLPASSLGDPLIAVAEACERVVVSIGPARFGQLRDEPAYFQFLKEAYETLARASEVEHNPALLAWARLQLAELEPLSVSRVLALSASLDQPNPEASQLTEVRDDRVPPLQQRAARIQTLLSQTELHPKPLPGSRRALDDVVIRGDIQYPLTLGQDRLADLQHWLAKKTTPQVPSLIAYCQPFGEVPHAQRGLELVCRLLGFERVDGYLSRGQRSRGIQAFAGPPPFVLLGGAHVLEDSELYLSESELVFALASELAYAKFGYPRSTSGDVWLGTLEKSQHGLGLAAQALPAVRVWARTHGFRRVSKALSQANAKRALKDVSELFRVAQEAREDDPDTATELTAANERLIPTHRLFQLNADRVGLVACGDIVAAALAMLKLRQDYRPILDTLKKSGLLRGLAPDNVEAVPADALRDLVQRLEACIAFYLSPQFERALKSTVR